MLARIFTRQTRATPDDCLAFVGEPNLFAAEYYDEIHISVSFTYDIEYGYKLFEIWSGRTDKISIGGPAFNNPGGDFVPGKYLKFGYVITSRGCPNNCWFCSVPSREGNVIKELPITNGWNILDDNLLACSDDHITSVFAMLQRVKKQYHKRIQFTGGLEAARLKDWHIHNLSLLKPEQIFLAYDTLDDYEPLLIAGKKLSDSGINKGALRCYVLCGYIGDSFDKAELRMRQVIDAGFIPMAMLYRDDKGIINRDWGKFSRLWSRPAIIKTLAK